MKYLKINEILDLLVNNKISQEEIDEFSTSIANTSISVILVDGDTEKYTHNGLVNPKQDAGVNLDGLRFLILADFLVFKGLIEKGTYGVDLAPEHPKFFAKWNRVDSSKFGGYRVLLPDFSKKKSEKAEKPKTDDEEEL